MVDRFLIKPTEIVSGRGLGRYAQPIFTEIFTVFVDKSARAGRLDETLSSGLPGRILSRPSEPHT
jgi:hypothetical protein